MQAQCYGLYFLDTNWQACIHHHSWPSPGHHLNEGLLCIIYMTEYLCFVPRARLHKYNSAITKKTITYGKAMTVIALWRKSVLLVFLINSIGQEAHNFVKVGAGVLECGWMFVHVWVCICVVRFVWEWISLFKSGKWS